MKNTPDEDGIWYIPLAILIAAVTFAAFLVPSAPVEAPVVEQVEEPQSMFIHKVYADELKPQVVQIATTSPEDVEPAVPELHPELQVICNCESAGHEHKDANGELLSGYVDPRDKGACQINTYYHGDTMEQMGLDIENDHDYYTYANYLFETQGKQPWMASAACWAPIIGYN